MNWIKKYLNKKEIKQCSLLGVDLCFSRKKYDRRQIPPLYFTIDCTIKNSILHIKGDIYPTYRYNYNRMIKLIKNGTISKRYKQIEHLNWIYNRMVKVHNENPNHDYMIKFKTTINKIIKQLNNN